METKKLIQIKKGASIRDTMLVIIIFVSFFGIFYAFILNNANEAGVVVDSRYNDTYNSLLAKQNNVSQLTSEISSAAANVTEAKIGDFAFFGLRGILALMKLPLELPSIAADALSLILIGIPLPDGLKFAINMGVLIVILFAIIKFITSRGTEA